MSILLAQISFCVLVRKHYRMQSRWRKEREGPQEVVFTPDPTLLLLHSLFFVQLTDCCPSCLLGHIQNMDQGPWTTSLTTPNFQQEIVPVNMKIYQRSAGYEQKHRLVFIAYVLEGLSRNSGLLWDRSAINGKTMNSFWGAEDLVHFYPQYFHSSL